jgi:hypothetical protein
LGPFAEAFRSGDFDAGLDGDCQNIVNPLLDGTKYLPRSVSAANYGNYDDPAEIELYDRMLRGTPSACALTSRTAMSMQYVPRTGSSEPGPT